jgi:hypothetical protein
VTVGFWTTKTSEQRAGPRGCNCGCAGRAAASLGIVPRMRNAECCWIERGQHLVLERVVVEVVVVAEQRRGETEMGGEEY